MTRPEVSVREATSSDIDDIVALNQAIALELEGVELDVARLSRGVGELLASREKGFYVLAEGDGKAIGVLMARYEWSPRRNSTFWWVDNVYVDPGWRRGGVYTAMYRYLVDESQRADGVCGIRLYASLGNDIARRTYRRLGMTGRPSEVFEIEYPL